MYFDPYLSNRGFSRFCGQCSSSKSAPPTTPSTLRSTNWRLLSFEKKLFGPASSVFCVIPLQQLDLTDDAGII